MKKFCFIFFALLLSPLPQRAQSLEGSGVAIAITNVTVIDTTGGPSRTDMTVIIDGDRITQVGKKSHTHVSKQTHVIDGTGKFLIPGLWDMHVHTFFGTWVPAGKKSRCRFSSPTELPASGIWAVNSI